MGNVTTHRQRDHGLFAETCGLDPEYDVDDASPHDGKGPNPLRG